MPDPAGRHCHGARLGSRPTPWWTYSIRESRSGEVPFADTGLPTVDPADIAAVARVGDDRAPIPTAVQLGSISGGRKTLYSIASRPGKEPDDPGLFTLIR
jgi:predicted metal-dependent enzyme (double-stranded beta helix superfamily)